TRKPCAPRKTTPSSSPTFPKPVCRCCAGQPWTAWVSITAKPSRNLTPSQSTSPNNSKTTASMFWSATCRSAPKPPPSTTHRLPLTPVLLSSTPYPCSSPRTRPGPRNLPTPVYPLLATTSNPRLVPPSPTAPWPHYSSPAA